MSKKISWIIAALLIMPYAALADTNTQNQTQNTAAAQTAPAIPPLLQHIRDAKQQLASIDLNYTLAPVYKTSKKNKILSGYTVSSKDAALAVWDPAAAQIIIAKGSLSGKIFDFSNSGVSVKQGAFNGVNTPFQVNSPAGGMVLAMKYLVTDPANGSKAAIENGLQQVVYVPYTAALNTPEIAQAGNQYLDDTLKTVFFQLNYVNSASQPGKKVTDAIQPSIIKALIYAEHMDTSSFISNSDVQSLINKVNVLFAINEGDTFKYSVSTSNARGIAQFLPSTYMSLVRRHPDANLIDDAMIGLSDHVNSIKAEMLLIDDYIAAVHAQLGDNFNPADMYDYGAASYNGGVSRVTKAVRTFGDNWNVDSTAQSAVLQLQISGQQAAIKILKTQISQTKDPAAKKQLQDQLSSENDNLKGLQNQLAALKSAGLRTETVLYLFKMHSLIQVFNAQSSQQS